MKPPPDIRNMKLLGGNAALDFVNTVDCRTEPVGPDLLADYGDLVTWAVRAGVIEASAGGALRALTKADPVGAGAALGRAKALREAIYRLFLAESRGEPMAEADIGRLDDWAGRALADRRLAVVDGRLAWTFAEAADLDVIGRRVALAATDLLLERDRRPVRECGGPRCGWLFLDTTRGGHKLWCSSAGCGTRVRVRRFRSSA